MAPSTTRRPGFWSTAWRLSPAMFPATYPPWYRMTCSRSYALPTFSCFATRNAAPHIQRRRPRTLSTALQRWSWSGFTQVRTFGRGTRTTPPCDGILCRSLTLVHLVARSARHRCFYSPCRRLSTSAELLVGVGRTGHRVSVCGRLQAHAWGCTRQNLPVVGDSVVCMSYACMYARRSCLVGCMCL